MQGKNDFRHTGAVKTDSFLFLVALEETLLAAILNIVKNKEISNVNLCFLIVGFVNTHIHTRKTCI